MLPAGLDKAEHTAAGADTSVGRPLALGPLAVVRVCFHQMWPWCWRIVVVVADDLAMACQAPESRDVGAPLALDPGRKPPSRRVNM